MDCSPAVGLLIQYVNSFLLGFGEEGEPYNYAGNSDNLRLVLALFKSAEAVFGGWVLFVPCALISLLMISTSWVRLIRYSILKREPPHADRSAAICIGGVFGALALLLLPIPGMAKWCWVPLVIDLNCLPAVFYAIYFWAFVLRRNPFEANPKGAVVCLNCGGLSADWVRWCASCGHNLEDAMVLPDVRPDRQCFISGKDRENVVCLSCRATNLSSNQHCYACGQALDDAPNADDLKHRRSRR